MTGIFFSLKDHNNMFYNFFNFELYTVEGSPNDGYRRGIFEQPHRTRYNKYCKICYLFVFRV